MRNSRDGGLEKRKMKEKELILLRLYNFLEDFVE
jgi:hypothetical protein